MSWTFLTVLFVLFALACVGFLLLRARPRGAGKSPSAPPPASQPAAPNYGYNLSGLVNLVYDEGRARRLVEAVQSRNPGMTYGWCVEKAIEQVLRDRRAR